MLAKIWKKLLLAICIIACIYNVMNKLVSRTSLETQLNSLEIESSTNEDEHKTSKAQSSSKTEKKVNYDEEDEEENEDEEFVIVFDE